LLPAHRNPSYLGRKSSPPATNPANGIAIVPHPSESDR
jgi:hypothetical protein